MTQREAAALELAGGKPGPQETFKVLPNAALSGRGPIAHQETWKHLPAVRLNA
jgi:hypothetical protein